MKIFDTKGWAKEVKILTWYGRKAKRDIRVWDENTDNMGKGLTLTKEELKTLKGLLNSLDIDELDI